MNVYNCSIQKIENEKIFFIIDTEKESNIFVKIGLYDVFGDEKTTHLIFVNNKYSYNISETSDIKECIFNCAVKYIIKNTSKIKSILKI